MTGRLAAALLVLAGTPAFSHRLDEYLQGTILSVETNRIEAQITLTPGITVSPLLLSEIDSDANGVISEAEQRSYAGRVLRDISLAIDGHRLAPRLVSMRFPTIAEMQEGRGEIHLDFNADLPRGAGNRKFTLENHHEKRIAAYQVNCLVPRDPHIRVVAQNRDYSQSHYELEYAQKDVRSDSVFSRLWSGELGWLSPFALLLFTRLVFLRRAGGSEKTR
jgi:hypothetical protein